MSEINLENLDNQSLLELLATMEGMDDALGDMEEEENEECAK